LQRARTRQNVAVVNNKPIPKAREDAWVKELTKQGQKDTPELRKMVKERLIQNEVLLQEATKRGIPEQADVKFMLDIQRQNTLIQALLRDEMTKHPVTDAEVQAEYDKQKSMVGSKEFARATSSSKTRPRPRDRRPAEEGRQVRGAGEEVEGHRVRGQWRRPGLGRS